jgi:4-hydroxy-tetrahydrodipicolinate synthase
MRVVAITIEEAKGRVPVLAGAGGYDTKHVIEMARELEGIGADGILSVTPYYNKPTQEGLYQHYEAIANASSLPIVVYSVQGRTGVNVEPNTLTRLSQIPNVVGVKEASGSISQMAAILARVPDSFLVLSGDDAITLPLIAIGGHGVISVVSNIIPAEWVAMTRKAMNGDFTNVRQLARKYQPLVEAAFVETNPGPVKAALASMGLLQPVWRLPMVPPAASSLEKIDSVLQSLNLLPGVRI